MENCELCKTITNEQIFKNTSIRKIDINTYDLIAWELIGFNNDEKYQELYAIPIKCCPECGDRLGDKSIEELDFTVRTYNCLKRVGINFLSELQQKTYDDLIQIRNCGQSNINEIREVLKRY
jgi:DNA-directed RNA polymerase subunit alpha